MTTKEEHEVDWARSWVEGQGMPALVEEEAQGLPSQVSLLARYHLASLTVLSLFCAESGLCDRPFFSLPGAVFIMTSKCIMGGGAVIGDGRAAESTVGCGRIRGRGSV